MWKLKYTSLTTISGLPWSPNSSMNNVSPQIIRHPILSFLVQSQSVLDFTIWNPMYLDDTNTPATSSFCDEASQTNITTLYCLPTGPLFPGQKENKHLREKYDIELLNYGREIMAPLTQPPIFVLTLKEIHIERGKNNAILIMDISFPLLKFSSCEKKSK